MGVAKQLARRRGEVCAGEPRRNLIITPGTEYLISMCPWLALLRGRHAPWTLQTLAMIIFSVHTEDT